MTGRILVVDDVATNRMVMKVKLAAACYEVMQAGDGTEALAMAAEARPDLILLDVLMPDFDGYEVCRKLKDRPATRDIPIVLLTSLSDPEDRLRGFASGADEFLSKPVTERELLARVRSLLRGRVGERDLQPRRSEQAPALPMGLAERATPFTGPSCTGHSCTGSAVTGTARGHIAVVAQDLGVAERLCRELAPHIRDELAPVTRETALGATKDRAAVFLIDGVSSGARWGLELLAELRARPASRTARVAILLPEKDRSMAARALDTGADAVLAARAAPQEVSLRLRAQMAQAERDETARRAVADRLRLAALDPLTGLANRRAAETALADFEAAPLGAGLAMIALDLDHFKAVNDRYGHDAGDRVLRNVAQVMQGRLRPSDLLARVGGEEFLVALPDTSREEAMAVADRLQQAVAQTDTPVPGDVRIRVTASVGIACAPIQGHPVPQHDMLLAADRALYAAKARGGDQVVVAESIAS